MNFSFDIYQYINKEIVDSIIKSVAVFLSFAFFICSYFLIKAFMKRKFKKIAMFTIILLSILSVFQFYYISQIKFNYDFESYFPQENKDIQFFKKFRDKFENDSDYLLFGIKNEPSIYNQAFLDSVYVLTKQLKSLEHVNKVVSPTSLKVDVINFAGAIRYPLIHRKSPERYASDSSYIYQNKDLVHSFFSEDGTSIAIFIKHKNMINREEATQLMEDLNGIIQKTSFQEVHLAGRIKAEYAYVRKMQNELIIFVSTSILLIILFLYVSFKSWWGVVIPMIVVLLSVLWCLGTMGMAGKPINLMTVLMPTIMFVVGMSDVVHIISKYLEELRKGKNKISALKTAFKEVGLATFLTSVTTAIGFLTLTTSGIGPIVSFGLYTAIGVFLAFLLAFTLLPSILIFQKKPTIVTKKGKQLFWNSMLQSLFIWLIGHRKTVVLIFTVITIISFLGIATIKVDVKFIDELSDSDPLKKDFLFFEDLFSGVRPFELAITLKDTTQSFYDYEVVKELETVERFLNTEFEIPNLISPLTSIKYLNRATNGGSANYYKIPETKMAYDKVAKLISKFKKAKQMQVIISESGNEARMTGNMVDVGSLKALQLKKQFYEYINNLDSKQLDYRVTGSVDLIDQTNDSISVNMIQGLLIAFAVIALLMGLLYKSFRIIAISLLPNIIPLLWIAGIIGFTGVGLKMSTAIIFTIAFGIAVDDTIHFMSKLKLELSKNRTLLYAIKRTFLSTGKAIIVTSCILVAGFLTLLFSSFEGTLYTGLLVSLTLIFAVFADLLLIPILLLAFYKQKKIIK